MVKLAHHYDEDDEKQARAQAADERARRQAAHDRFQQGGAKSKRKGPAYNVESGAAFHSVRAARRHARWGFPRAPNPEPLNLRPRSSH